MYETKKARAYEIAVVVRDIRVSVTVHEDNTGQSIIIYNFPHSLHPFHSVVSMAVFKHANKLKEIAVGRLREKSGRFGSEICVWG